MMEEQHDAETRKAQIKLFLGSMVPVAGIDLIAHGGLPGLAIGGVAAFLLAKHSPEIKEQFRELFPLLPMPQAQGRSLKDRMLGIYPDEQDEVMTFSQTDDAIDEGDTLPYHPRVDGEYYNPQKHTEHLHMGDLLYPHADRVLSNRIVILGMPGAGKSNFVAVLSEELGRFGVPLLIFDTEDEYRPLCHKDFFPNPAPAGANNINVKNAYQAGRTIMSKRLQCVLNLQSYDNDDVAAEIMIKMVEGIADWEEEQRNAGEDPIPCTLFLEEATYWLPQNASESTVSKQKDEDGNTLLGRLQQTFFGVVRRGRKRGIGVVFSTQRIAEIDNRAIGVAEWKFLLKANLPNDLKVYAKMGLDAETAMALDRGEAYVLGQNVQGVFQIRKRLSNDNGKTPGLASLQRYNQMPTSKPSQASSESTSFATSDSTSRCWSTSGQLEVERSEQGRETKRVEVVSPLPPLPERERAIGRMFFQEQKTVGEIMKEFHPGVTGGGAYQRAVAEINDAIRKYAQTELS